MSKIIRNNNANGKKFRVKEGFKEDLGRGIARIDPEVIKELKLKIGDVISIINEVTDKKTAAIIYPGYQKDIGNKTIRIDARLRRSIESSIDDIVKINRIYPKLAQQVSFAGLDDAIVIKNADILAEKIGVRSQDVYELMDQWDIKRKPHGFRNQLKGPPRFLGDL